MYVSEKIVGFGVSMKGADFVVLRSEDYTAQAGLMRSTYRRTISDAKAEGERSSFGNESTPDSGMFVAVEVKRLKEVHPVWCLTNKQLLAQYTARQRDDDDGRAEFAKLVKETKVDIFMDPVLKAKASVLWSEAVRNTSSTK